MMGSAHSLPEVRLNAHLRNHYIQYWQLNIPPSKTYQGNWQHSSFKAIKMFQALRSLFNAHPCIQLTVLLLFFRPATSNTVPILKSTLPIGDYASHSGARFSSEESSLFGSESVSLCMRWDVSIYSTVAGVALKLFSFLGDSPPEILSMLAYWPNHVFVFGHPTGVEKAWR